ncbi:hypothetical protein ACH4SP_10820 [Streptomyces sp. NPDC021093]|uniref:hypothetical protein n=1 Tax=Streptomyces sp. NPDC021093 TaxID=3365112 RepID=UPI0037966078
MARFKCQCGHGRYQHGVPDRWGRCGKCACAAYVYAAQAVAQSRTRADEQPEGDRAPHPLCPLGDPDCTGFHPTIGW